MAVSFAHDVAYEVVHAAGVELIYNSSQPELAELLPRFEQLMADVEYFDLRDPVLSSP